MTPRLRNAIENAYSAFDLRVLGSKLEVCHCDSCMSVEMSNSILKTPLRELSNEQLSEYTNSAHGWSDQFLYFLPRYMELIAQGQRPTYLDPDHILSRFHYAPEGAMTSSEAKAFDEWLLALFESALCSPITPEELECALAQQGQLHWSEFGNDVCDLIEIALPTPFAPQRLQKIWETYNTKEADLRLASTLVFGIGAQRFYSSRFHLERTRSAAAQWYEWFALASHAEKLITACDREQDPQVQAFLLSAL